jgi:hypothetical protein
LSNDLFLDEIALDRDDNHDIKLSYLENLTFRSATQVDRTRIQTCSVAELLFH